MQLINSKWLNKDNKMSEENTTQEAEVTTSEVQEVETQPVETQSTEQAETTQESASLGKSLEIEAKEESETSEVAQPSIDDIVNEALSGELSEETRKLIDENGLGKHIDMLVAGHQAIQDKNNQEIFKVVGGEKSYSELQEWGKNNLSKEEQKSFNDALFSGDMYLAKLAVQGLQAQYVAQNGKEPIKVIEGGGTSNEANRPFSSQMDYIKATQTFEYKRNPEYRQQVESKRRLSGF